MAPVSEKCHAEECHAENFVQHPRIVVSLWTATVSKANRGQSSWFGLGLLHKKKNEKTADGSYVW